MVSQKINNVKFIFAAGSSEQKLKQLIEKLNIQNHIIFRRVPYTKMLAYLANADVY